MYNEMIVTDWYVDNNDDDVGLYINLLIMSVPIFSHKDNYYIFIQSNYAFIGLCRGGDIYIYIYIYGYNLFVIIYNDGVVLVWMIEYRHPLLSILYIGSNPIFKKQ